MDNANMESITTFSIRSSKKVKKVPRFDDEVHDQLGKIANQRGVSINSIVKDAVDKWLRKQQSQVPRKHDLIIYSDDQSMMRIGPWIGLLKKVVCLDVSLDHHTVPHLNF